MKHIAAIRMNKLQIHPTWMNLTNSKLRGRNQTQKGRTSVIESATTQN